jgi:hypothetical protein
VVRPQALQLGHRPTLPRPAVRDDYAGGLPSHQV